MEKNDDMENWTVDGSYTLNNKFGKIIKFYVFETPVPGVSKRGKTFKDRNINLNKLASSLKKESKFLEDSWKSSTIKNMQDELVKLSLDKMVYPPKEIALHTKNDKHCKNSKVSSLFYAIRCAFAHGSFSIKDYKGINYIYLENCDGGKIKARMIFKEDTLVKWIKIIDKMSE